MCAQTAISKVDWWLRPIFSQSDRLPAAFGTASANNNQPRLQSSKRAGFTADRIMAMVTLQVLDGADRGRVFEDLATPITIGREEGNTIQLNDERVSRFHLKIQEDQGRVVLTDLQSTNGTKVNGEDMQLRILRFGDMITVGRSVLLFGSRDQIADRLATLRKAQGHERPPGVDPRKTLGADDFADSSAPANFDSELHWAEDPQVQATLHALEAPELPDRLSPGQAAQLADLLNFFHIRMRHLLESVSVDKGTESVSLEARQWQNLLDLQMRLAKYLREIGEPQSWE